MIKGEDSDDGFEHISGLDLATENVSFNQEINTTVDQQKTIDVGQIGHELEEQKNGKREANQSKNLANEQMKDEMNEAVYECATPSNEAMVRAK